MLLSHHRVPHDVYDDMPDADDLERLVLERINDGLMYDGLLSPLLLLDGGGLDGGGLDGGGLDGGGLDGVGLDGVGLDGVGLDGGGLDGVGLDGGLDEEMMMAMFSIDPPMAAVMHLAPEAIVAAVTYQQPKRVKTGWRSDPSEPEFESTTTHADATAGGERVASDRRAAHKNPVKYAMLPDRIRNSLPPTAMVDAISVPSIELDGVEYLDVSRIANEMCRAGDEAPSLSTIALSRSSLVSMVNAGMRGAYRGAAFQFADYRAAIMNLPALVGNVVPVFGQIRTPSRDADTRRSAFASNSMPIGAEAHSFAFSPVVIATIGDTPGDQGEIVAQGIIVSNKAINYAVGDDRRVSLGRNPAFEESMCLVLITHVYPTPITYAGIGPCGTRKQGNEYATVVEEGRNAYDPVFMWNEFMASRRTQRGCGVSTFGFTDTKQSGKDIARQLFPWSIAHSQSVLWDFRAQDGGLRRFLLETPMTMAGKRASAREDCPSGIDVRRFLLAELLLLDTPLESLLRGEKPEFIFPSPLAFDPAWVF